MRRASAISSRSFDTVSGHTRELFSVLPYQNPDLTISRDNRYLYVSVRANEADVWVTTPR